MTTTVDYERSGRERDPRRALPKEGRDRPTAQDHPLTATYALLRLGGLLVYIRLVHKNALHVTDDFPDLGIHVPVASAEGTVFACKGAFTFLLLVNRPLNEII